MKNTVTFFAHDGKVLIHLAWLTNNHRHAYSIPLPNAGMKLNSCHVAISKPVTMSGPCKHVDYVITCKEGEVQLNRKLTAYCRVFLLDAY